MWRYLCAIWLVQFLFGLALISRPTLEEVEEDEQDDFEANKLIEDGTQG